MYRGRINRWFVAVIWFVTAATITDIFGMALEIVGSGYHVWKYLFNLICLWATAMIPVMLGGYLFAQTNLWNLNRSNRLFKVIYYVPAIINTFILFFVNPINHIIFFINDEGFYERGDGVALLYVLALVYVYIGCCVAINYRRLYSFRKLSAIILLMSSSVIATLIQVVFSNIIIQMFCTAVFAVVLLLEVQSPEERLHVGTGLYGIHAYASDVKNLFGVGAQFYVTLITMTNYSAIVEMIGYFNALSVVEQAANRLMKYTKENKIDADIYYLESGHFAVIMDDRYADHRFEIGQSINKIMNTEFEIGQTKIVALSNVCAIGCPDDIDDADYLIACDDKLSMEGYSGELRYAEKMFFQNEFELKRDFSKILDESFENKYLDVHYQPVYSIEHSRFICAEAFIRLNHPEYGYISPDIIVAEAEKTDSIHAITTYVFEEVCKFISNPDFLLLGLEFVEINVSPVQCMWSDLIAVVLSTLRHYNVQPKQICLNVTDVDDYEIYSRMKSNLEALSQIGFMLIMDDFGVGIFEIERIVEMPLRGIKLDRQFVRNGFSEENISVLKGTVRMINDIGIEAAAVGVEDEQTYNQLVDLGCKYVQGFYFCKPMEKLELIKYLLLN